MIRKRYVMLLAFVGALGLSAWYSVEPSRAGLLDQPSLSLGSLDPIKLTDEARKAAIKKAEELAEELKRKAREEAHAQLEKQLKVIDENLKQQIDKLKS